MIASIWSSYQDGLRIQCVLMVNAKLDPQELPENTLQVSINNNNNNINNKGKDLLLKVMVVLNIFLHLLNLQLDISKNDLRMLQRDFFVKVTAISI